MNRINIKEFFVKYLSEIKDRCSSGYQSTNNYVSNTFNAYFYEFSSMAMPGKHFSDRDLFIKFLEDSHIVISDEYKELIKKHNLVYGICLSSGELLMATKYIDLRDSFNDKNK